MFLLRSIQVPERKNERTKSTNNNDNDTIVYKPNILRSRRKVLVSIIIHDYTCFMYSSL